MVTGRQRHYYFRLQISNERFLRYYQGNANSVVVTAECGKSLRFPAARLRPLLTRNGISGRFRLTVDQNNRFISLKPV